MPKPAIDALGGIPEVMIFEGRESYDNFMDMVGEHGQDVLYERKMKAKAPVVPATPPPKQHPKNPYAKKPIDVDSDELPVLKMPSSGEKRKEAPDQSLNTPMAESPFTQRFKKKMNTKGIKIKVHYWPGIPDSAVVQPVVIEVTDSRQGFTHWLQRGDAWRDVIDTWAQDPFNSPPRMIEYIRVVRLVNTHGVVDTKTVKRKGDNSEVVIRREGFLTFVRQGLTEGDIIRTVGKGLNLLFNNQDHQMCYQAGVANDIPPGRKDNISHHLVPMKGEGGGEYWKMLLASLEYISVHAHHHMKEVLLEEDIVPAIVTMFTDCKEIEVINRNIPSTHIAFAFGE